jgi:hypothetical protein
MRKLGLDNTESLVIILTATMRYFASKTFDAPGAEPDDIYKEIESQLSDMLPA